MLVNTRLNAGEAQSGVSLSEAILDPAAAHGGLYAPDTLPRLDDEFFAWAAGASYADIALAIFAKFKFDVSEEEFRAALSRYESFDTDPVEIHKFDENVYINELWHGPTRAFKDMALQPFGALVDGFAAKNGKKYLVMCATSGDTGPATLETFKGAKNVRVVCLYPIGATSAVQRLQMVTADAPNLAVIGVKGNFDDAQKALKTLLNDADFRAALAAKNLHLSAANSVNIGRILFQVIYHVYACVKINANREPLNIIVPSGNFGDALGAYYARKMGANIATIGIASNANNTLTQLIREGRYDLRGRALTPTISPAMDILVSSNIERLLFDLFGAVRTKELMERLANERHYELSADELAKIQEIFYADFCTDSECEIAIKFAAAKGKLVDPHTATCFKMIKRGVTNVLTSTAQWVKFTPSMIKAIKGRACEDEEREMNALASEFGVSVPSQIAALFDAKQAQNLNAEVSELKDKILELIK